MLLNDLKLIMNRFGGNNNICSISSLDSETLDSGGKENISENFGAITTTSNDVIAHIKTRV